MSIAELSRRFVLGLIGWVAAVPASFAQAEEGTSRALIINGLAGDPAHDQLFRSTAVCWRDWLVDSLGFPPGQVQILSASKPEAEDLKHLSATRDSIEHTIAAIRVASSANDRLWVFVLGHADLDDGRARLHLPGPDIASDQFARLFDQIPGREQVFWITTAASGAFVKPLSKQGRVVIAATAPVGESNETEFPHALADVLREPPAKIDFNNDGEISLLEVFEATNRAVLLRFQADRRVPTEHSRIDDDGDGVGMESPLIVKSDKPDGVLASKIVLVILAKSSSPHPSPRSENGTKSVVHPAR